MKKFDKKLVGQYAYAFTSPEGRAVLDDLKAISGYDEFLETKDPIEMAYQAGKRDMFLYIKTIVEETK